MAMYDLLIAGGRVIDPSQELDDVRDIAIADGKISALEKAIPPSEGRRVLDARGRIVTPGLIDIHVHVYEGVSHYGVNADTNCLHKGVTTAVDAGSAGANTFPGLRQYVIDVSQTRILAYLNLSMIGMLTECPPGELEELRYADTRAALQTIESNRDVLLGIKMRLEKDMVGENGYEVLKRGREVSDAAGLPIMVHFGNSVPPLREILSEMRAGDVLTHCFHDRPDGVLADGKVRPEVRAAAGRGVLFDLGHGRGSFSFEVARQALAQDFPPGTISSDVHAHNVHGPVFDLVKTMSKFLHLGMSLPEIVKKTTLEPARSIRMEDQLGSLRPGALGDVTILELVDGPVSLTDASKSRERETVIADQALIPSGVVKGGEVVFSAARK